MGSCNLFQDQELAFLRGAFDEVTRHFENKARGGVLWSMGLREVDILKQYRCRLAALRFQTSTQLTLRGTRDSLEGKGNLDTSKLAGAR